MPNLGFETFVVLLVLVGLVCGVAGYTIARLGQRRAGGGKSAQELKSELGEYKENVMEHFQTTANLLHVMTEQYRSVYEHMASGAQNLCDPELAKSHIERLQAGLLPVLDTATIDEDDSSIDENSDQTLSMNDTISSEGALAENSSEDLAEPVPNELDLPPVSSNDAPQTLASTEEGDVDAPGDTSERGPSPPDPAAAPKL